MTNVNGQYFLINKHKLKKGGRKLRRRFYTKDELDEARKMGAKYAAENHEDYLIVQVIDEVSSPSTGSKNVEQKETLDER